MSLTVSCPQCHKVVVWSVENPHRPFCCKRCQLIDLGEWAAEEKAIPCGANQDAETAESAHIDIEEIEALLAQQQQDFFKS